LVIAPKSEIDVSLRRDYYTNVNKRMENGTAVVSSGGTTVDEK
jgi:hypothetical protein